LVTVTDEGSILGNIVAGINGCLVVCLSVQLQGGKVTISGGTFGLGGKGVYVGWANKAVCSRQSTSADAFGGEGLTLGGSVGAGNNGIDASDYEIDVGAGGGGITPVSGGFMHTLWTFGTPC
jgi:hypothetical protein